MSDNAYLYSRAVELINESKASAKMKVPPCDLEINGMSCVAAQLFERKQFEMAGKVDKALYNWIELIIDA